MWRITINETCIGSGSCVGLAPQYFDLDDVEGRADPIDPDVQPDEAVLDAVASCPMEAISVVDLETGKTVDA